MRRTASCLVVALGLLASLVVTSGHAAVASVAHPTLKGALYQLAGKPGCTTSIQTAGCQYNLNIASPRSIAIAPGGRQVATVQSAYAAVVIWNRNPSTGALTFAQCISKTGAMYTGTGGYSCIANPQLDLPESALFTADGKSLLIVSSSGGAAGSIVNFSRNPGNGDLTLNGLKPCSNNDGTGGCSKVRSLAGAQVIAQDNYSGVIYVGSEVGLIAFNQDPSTHVLRHFDCLNTGGTIGCHKDVAIGRVTGIAVEQGSGNGVLWVTSSLPGTLNSLYVNDTGTPSLDPLQCYARNTKGCHKTKAVNVPTGLAITQATASQAESIYVTDFNENSLLEFTDNNQVGLAAYGGCRSYTGSIPAATSVSCVRDYNIAFPRGLAVSPDGRNLYVTSAKGNPATGAQLVAVYSREPTSGAIAPYPGQMVCLRSAEKGAPCPVARGMVGPSSIAVSADGRNVYVGDGEGDAILSLHRALPPTCKAIKKKTKHDKPARFNLHCTDPNGDAILYDVGKVKHGHVGKVKNGKVKLTPKKRFKGTASFQFIASDGGLLSAAYKDKLKTTKSKRKHHHRHH